VSLILVLLLIFAGIAIGGAGMRRVGALARRVTGPWRPGVGVLSMVALIAALALASRGQDVFAAGLVALCLVLAVLARRRAPRKAAAPGPASQGMSRADAAGLLGVPVDAPPAAVEAAYRRLMLRTHPDVGGTVGLAAQLNAARAAMLR